MKSISLSLHAYNYSYILLQSNSQDSFAGLLRVTTYSSSFFVSSVRLSSKCQSSLACSEAGNPVGPLTPKGVSWRRRVNCEAALQKVCGGWGEVGDSQNWAVPIFFAVCMRISGSDLRNVWLCACSSKLRASRRRCFPRRCEVLLKTMRDTGNDDNPAKQLGWVGGKGRQWAAWLHRLAGRGFATLGFTYIESHGFLSKGKWSTNSNPLYGRMLIDWLVFGRLWLLWITNPSMIWRETWQKSIEISSRADHKIEQGKQRKTLCPSMSICFEYATGWRLQLIFNDVPFSFQKRGQLFDCSRMWSRMHGNTGPGPFDCFFSGEMDDQVV